MPTIDELHELYSNDPNGLWKTINSIYDRIENEGLKPIWISIVPREKALKRVEELLSISQNDENEYPLFGIPFAVKDNIDVIDLKTTAACSSFGGGEKARKSAFVVCKLEKAGAIVIGKTNLDQFATGLVGTRSSFGICSSVFNKNFISGGSSSGSAVSVAQGFVTFALGTDTAGSGRVPAMFNNIIGMKPTRGLLSCSGVLPACRSVDCVSIFAETSKDASIILSVARGYDKNDPYSRELSFCSSPWIISSKFRCGVPTKSTRQFFNDLENGQLYENVIRTVENELNGEIIEFDFTSFIKVANLLYKGPWVAERYASVGKFVDEHQCDVDPTVFSIISKSKSYSAVDVFNSMYEFEKLKKETKELWKKFDVMLVPTAPRTFTIDEIHQSPIEFNTQLGFYTNFVNLLDLTAIALPAGLRQDHLPFGVTFISHSFTDQALLLLADRLHRCLSTFIGHSTTHLLSNTSTLTMRQDDEQWNCFLIGVVGAHLSDQPLNYQLIERNARLVRKCRTHHEYRLYALQNTNPCKPGLIRINGSQGPGIEIEIWAIPNEQLANFINLISSPLSIGNILLDDGQSVKGFLVEPSGAEKAKDITHFGGWKAYLNTLE